MLFFGLFVVNGALAESGMLARALSEVAARGLDLARVPMLFGATVVLSNLVSNVPAVMLLLPAASHPLSGPALALASTLAGNLFVVGSIANIIVVDQAARLGVAIERAERRLPAFNAWQTLKGTVVLAAVVAAFLVAPWPREAVALAGAGLLLTSRRMASRDVLGLDIS